MAARLAFNARERFAMCSTFKVMLVAAILKRVAARALAFDDRLPVREQDMVPYAPITSLQKVLVGDVLAPQSRQQLIAWMQQSTTGLSRLRAGVPADWRPGDKTGNGRNGAANDLLVAWPPGRDRSGLYE